MSNERYKLLSKRRVVLEEILKRSLIDSHRLVIESMLEEFSIEQLNIITSQEGGEK